MQNNFNEALVQSQEHHKIIFSDYDINKVVYNGMLCRLNISTDSLIFTNEDSNRTECSVKLCDVIGCREAKMTKKTAHSFAHRCIEVYSYPLPESKCFASFTHSTLRSRRVHSFTVVDANACENVINVIRTMARGFPLTRDANGAYRPPKPLKYLIFINPVGGTGKALQIWHKESEHMFHEANIECQIIVTERADHAKDICSTRDMSDVNGVAIVGGDGLIFEVVSGLSSRPGGKKDVLRSLPLIPIPGGSGNGLAKSISFECGEECNATTASFIAIKGTATPLDVSRVTTSTKEYSSFLLFGWGLTSDSDILSESMRWMGEPRFSVAGAYFLLKRHLYRGRLSMLLYDKDHPTSSLAVLPPLKEPLDLNSHNWKVIEDDFLMLWVGQTSHCSTSMHSSPGSTLSDGVFTILVVRGNFSRFDMAKLLLALDSSGNHFKHPKAEIFKAKAYRLEPLCTEGIYTLDGERIDYGPLQAIVLPHSENCISVLSTRK